MQTSQWPKQFGFIFFWVIGSHLIGSLELKLGMVQWFQLSSALSFPSLLIAILFQGNTGSKDLSQGPQLLGHRPELVRACYVSIARGEQQASRRELGEASFAVPHHLHYHLIPPPPRHPRKSCLPILPVPKRSGTTSLSNLPPIT